MENLFFGLLLIITLTFEVSSTKNVGNQCMLKHNGCEYELLLKSTDCMVMDAPTGGAESNVHSSVNNIIDSMPSKEEISIKRLDSLEKKLTKMMEGLSVRSLRHIRQIRNDLRSMSETMDSIKDQQETVDESKEGSKKNKRGLSPVKSCPEEFVGVGTWSSCYHFSTFNATWHDAREYCNAFDADLVALETVKESYILDYLIRSNSEYLKPKGWWSAGNYVPRQSRWMWTSRYHLTPMHSSRWAPGEPNARSTMHCLQLYKEANYRWHDGTCSDKHNFICEIELYKRDTRLHL